MEFRFVIAGDIVSDTPKNPTNKAFRNLAVGLIHHLYFFSVLKYCTRLDRQHYKKNAILHCNVLKLHLLWWSQVAT